MSCMSSWFFPSDCVKSLVIKPTRSFFAHGLIGHIAVTAQPFVPSAGLAFGVVNGAFYANPHSFSPNASGHS